MKLIDAEKLVPKHFWQRTDKIIGYGGTQPIYEYVDVIAYDVDGAPTVEAIPIEWIKEWAMKSENTYNREQIIEMLNDWGKENG